jgi:hypothetical protein
MQPNKHFAKYFLLAVYCRASEILSGARIDPENLERLKFTINSEPLPALKGMPV